MKIFKSLSICKKLISVRGLPSNRDRFFVVTKTDFIKFLKRYEKTNKGEVVSEIYSDFYVVKKQRIDSPVAFARVAGTNPDGSRDMVYCIHGLHAI